MDVTAIYPEFQPFKAHAAIRITAFEYTNRKLKRQAEKEMARIADVIAEIESLFYDHLFSNEGWDYKHIYITCLEEYRRRMRLIQKQYAFKLMRPNMDWREEMFRPIEKAYK